MQVEAGADILQVFEAMGGFISEDHFYDRAMPYLERYEKTSLEGTIHVIILEKGMIKSSLSYLKRV